MDDEGPSIGIRRIAIVLLLAAVLAALSLIPGGLLTRSSQGDAVVLAQSTNPAPEAGASTARNQIVADAFPAEIMVLLIVLLTLSAFFSASEVAFFGIHQLRLRGMSEEEGRLGPMVASLMQHPGRLLTTILTANTLVNVAISVVLPLRIERLIEEAFSVSAPVSYFITVGLSTMVLVFFGEITPKVLALRVSELYARTAVIPLKVVDILLGPARWSAIKFTEFLFRVTRLDDVEPAPFITDEEFLRVVSDSEAEGVIEQEEGQMIQGIIESGESYLREILVPRPDVIAIEKDASVKEALDTFREHEYSRMPVFEEDLDHIIGVLVAKDLLPSAVKGDMEKSIGSFARRPNFVPETMTIREFVRDAQRKRMHLSIVVDEYGGTEGIATLEDAMEEIVGDIRDEDEETFGSVVPLGNGAFQVVGSLPLDELSEKIGVDLKDSDHETVAGFFIDQSSKIPEKGDYVTHNGLEFHVMELDGKRIAQLRVQIIKQHDQEGTV